MYQRIMLFKKSTTEGKKTKVINRYRTEQAIRQLQIATESWSEFISASCYRAIKVFFISNVLAIDIKGRGRVNDN